jgi:hypothetical protein
LLEAATSVPRIALDAVALTPRERAQVVKKAVISSRESTEFHS